MKKIVAILLSIGLLVGCEAPQYKEIKNVEYIGNVKTIKDNIVQFKDDSGKIFNLYWDVNVSDGEFKSIPMKVGSKYNIKITIADSLKIGDCVEDVAAVD